MKGKIYMFGLILLTLWGCERRAVDPNLVVESPYTLVGYIDGEDYTVGLGANEFKLAPTFERSSFGVYRFISDYHNSSSEDNIKICFNDDSQEWNNRLVDARELWDTLGVREFQTESLNLEHNRLEIRGEEVVGVEYEWSFNGIVSEETGSIVDPYVVGVDEELMIGLKLQAEGLTVDSLVLNVDQQFQVDSPVDYNFFYPEYNGDQVICRYDGDLTKVDYIIWSGQRPDGTFLAAEEGSNAVFYDMQDGVYNILMTVHLKNNVTFKHARHIVYPASATDQIANIQFRTSIDQGDDISNTLSNVVIEFEQDGKFYSSVNHANGSSSDVEFEVIDVLSQVTNNYGQSAQELVVSFSCDMQNTEDVNDILEFRDFQGTIVVAYPTPID